MIRKRDILAFAVFVMIAAVAAIFVYFLPDLFQPEPTASPTPSVAGPHSTTPTVAVLEMQAREARVIADVATLRVGPGVESDLVGTLQRGETVIVVGMSPGGNWYLVTLSDPQGGIDQVWIAAEFIEFVTVTPALTPSNTPTIEITAAEPTAEATIVPSATSRPAPVATRPKPSFPTATPLPPEEPSPTPTATPPLPEEPSPTPSGTPSATPTPTTPPPPPGPSGTTEPGPPTVMPPTPPPNPPGTTEPGPPTVIPPGH